MLCAVLNISQPAASFIICNKTTGSAVDDVRESSMLQAAREAVAEDEGDDPSHKTACFDGSWQKRGHTSLNGIISATSVDTGKVSELEIMSKFCFVCHTKLTSQHECKKNCEGKSVEWKVLVYLTFLIILFIPEVFVTQSILVMGTANHTRGWLQGNLMIPT
jgi:hypothetical protein